MNLKSLFLNLMYGNPVLVETIPAPGIAVVTAYGEKDWDENRFEIVPIQDVWKRRRQKRSFLGKPYVKLPDMIQLPYAISYHADWEPIE